MLGSSVVICVFLQGLLEAAMIPPTGTTHSNERVCGGTPVTLKQDFIKSCGLTGYNPDYCDLAWRKFMEAFSGKDPATITGRLVAILSRAMGGMTPQNFGHEDITPYRAQLEDVLSENSQCLAKINIPIQLTVNSPYY